MILIIYILIMNATSFLLMHADKKKAIHHQYRIPESVLFIIAACGGSLGCYWGMKFFRHKTKKPLFYIGIPIIISIQIIIILLSACFFNISLDFPGNLWEIINRLLLKKKELLLWKQI